MESANTDSPAAVEQKKQTNVVERIHEMLKQKGTKLADEFLELKHVKLAQQPDVPAKQQRELVNRQLRLHLGLKKEDTALARLALDDNCDSPEYFRNFKRYALPQL